MSEALYYENEQLWHADRYALDPAERARFEACVAMLPPGTGTLLDAGCGNGQFLAYLEERHPALSVRGVERARAAIARRVCSAPVDEASIDALPYADASYDLVSAQEVIEHLPYGVYEAALAELARVAREHVLISVPFHEPRVQAHCPYCGCAFNPHYHMRSYTRADLEGLVPGFQLARMEGVWTRRRYVMDGTLRGLRRGWFPAQARCPLCGYTESAAAGNGNGNGAGKPAPAPARSGALSLLKRLWPATTSPRWAVVLYRRAGSGG